MLQAAPHQHLQQYHRDEQAASRMTQQNIRHLCAAHQADACLPTACSGISASHPYRSRRAPPQQHPWQTTARPSPSPAPGSSPQLRRSWQQHGRSSLQRRPRPAEKLAARQLLQTSDSLCFDDDALRAAAIEHGLLGRVIAATAAVDLAGDEFGPGAYEHIHIGPAQPAAGAQAESQQQQGAPAAIAEPHLDATPQAHLAAAPPQPAGILDLHATTASAASKECNTGEDVSQAAADSSVRVALPASNLESVSGTIAALDPARLQAAPAAAAGDVPCNLPKPQSSCSSNGAPVEGHEIVWPVPSLRSRRVTQQAAPSEQLPAGPPPAAPSPAAGAAALDVNPPEAVLLAKPPVKLLPADNGMPVVGSDSQTSPPAVVIPTA